MLIVIPMSGVGQRFQDAGYKDPKPLIQVDGKPIIEHVINLFPKNARFLFICNQTHLKTTRIADVLKNAAPNSEIVDVAPHKRGPVYAVAQHFDKIPDNEEVIVNYCDFSSYWNYDDFISHTQSRNADGAIPAYKGFHPHMLKDPNYAFMRDDHQWMLEIQEKKPFTDNRMNEYASNGTYYFKSGSLVKTYFKKALDEDLNVNGECYVSLIYNLLVKDGLNVSIYDVQHMCQWGTPQDLEEYVGWSNMFRALSENEQRAALPENALCLLPMAGLGSRFRNEGYETPKPLIEVSGYPMVAQAVRMLPEADETRFVCLAEHLQNYPIKEQLSASVPNASFSEINGLTEGQAITCSLGLDPEEDDRPLLIGACDNGMIYQSDKWNTLVNNQSVDAVIWSFKGHPGAKEKPEMYGWIKTDESDTVIGMSVKVPISDTPENDHAVVGSFYFKNAGVFNAGLERLIKNNNRVNNEYYVDSLMGELVELGYTVKVFQVDHYIGWGTPADYESFRYWQSFFHKCDWHPYRLEKDRFMKQEKVSEYDSQYRQWEQAYA